MNSLPEDISERELYRELERYGSLVRLKTFRRATNSKKTTLGIAYFDKKSNASRAVEHLNKT